MKKTGEIIATATNDFVNHAEVNVINQAKKKYSKKQLIELCQKGRGFIIEVVRFSKTGDGFKNSHPCDNCLKRINKCPGIVEIKHS